MDLLISLNRTENITLVVVTHANDLAQLFKRVFTITKGRLSDKNNSSWK
jgi:ABC-type lipoprotein export system ATPase subunit